MTTAIIAKNETTNSVNNDVNIEWKEFSSEKDFTNWESQINATTDNWNYHTPGANSTRYTVVACYSFEEVGELTLQELQGMTLNLFTRIQDELRKIKGEAV